MIPSTFVPTGASRRMLVSAILVVVFASAGLAQQANGVHGTQNVNATAVGAAPYAAPVFTSDTLSIAVSGGTNKPFVLFSGPLSVGSFIFPGGTGQVDVGPTRHVVVDGYAGTLLERLTANTGAAGSTTLNVPIPSSFAPTSSTSTALQSIVIDFAYPPHYLAVTAATNVTVTPSPTVAANAGLDKNCLTAQTGVTLDGSASSVSGSLGTITYQWSYLGTLSGVVITNPTSAIATFTAPTATALVNSLSPSANSTMPFQLVVSNGTTTDADIVNVSVRFSYAQDVKPLWSSSSCTGCHGSSGGSGSLALGGTTAQSYAQLFAPANTSGQQRVNLTTPAASLIVTKPGYNIPNDTSHGGGNNYNGPTNANYLKILTWIQQGAPNN